ncbi:hypothetical protein HOU08_gp302 [Dickeya phage vB_DsoM_JA29]|uniref:Uncharacterized protein n=1 Tax=Dickeya phage vB_DsoM_JA29 TaxID=2283031 RepID=A0A384ZXQ2_9CAUD|nr:hypothetical protein HOU08_gp302 [Dickeya phage vB_DsoM_JA29]AXG67028.1 hypothetical protein JA29_302 [Dickeya phage vB_DsoM_JA29]
MAITPNKDLINVVVRLLDGKTSRITGITKTGYTVEGVDKQIPMTELVRKGRVLQQIDPAKLKDLPANQTYLMSDGYLHIHTRDAMRRIKKGETVDIPPSKTEWQRKTKTVKIVKPKGEVKPKKITPNKPVRADVSKVKTAPKRLKTDAQKTKKAVTKSVTKSTPVDRTAETTETLFLVIENARSNRKAFKEFKNIVSTAIGVTAKDLPDTANEIIEKFGAAKVRKGLAALSEHFNRRRAELSLPRSLKAFIASGRLTLTPAQLRQVLEVIAPTIPKEVVADVVKYYFSGEFFIGKTPDRNTPKKVNGGN